MYLSHSGFLSNLRLSWIRCIEYIFFTVTCGEVRDWGGTVSFKPKFANVWIEWSSINSPLNWLHAEWLMLMLSTPYHNLLHIYRHNGDSRLENFTESLKHSYNLCIRLECMQWSNRECRPSVWSAAAENFNEICKVKAWLREVLQITIAQQHAPINFILPSLKLNRTGGSTHWRRKYKLRSIRSTKNDRLNTRMRCSHNKQSEAPRITFARLCSSVGVS